LLNIFIGILLSSSISIYAFKKRSLSKSGTLSAILLGSLLYLFGGFYFFALMISFFISSSLLTKFKKNKKEELEIMHEKTGNRDYTQVFSNSFAAIVYAFLYYITSMHVFILAFATVFSATNSDTWASELGVLSKKRPFSILNGKILQRGMSGGITSLGTLASFFGALLVSFVFVVGYVFKFNGIKGFKDIIVSFILILTGGFLGSIIDSILGASIQGIYENIKTKQITEKRFENGMENKLIRGFKFINNNMVNFLSSLLASVLVVVVYYFVLNN